MQCIGGCAAVLPETWLPAAGPARPFSPPHRTAPAPNGHFSDRLRLGRPPRLPASVSLHISRDTHRLLLIARIDEREPHMHGPKLCECNGHDTLQRRDSRLISAWPVDRRKKFCYSPAAKQAKGGYASPAGQPDNVLVVLFAYRWGLSFFWAAKSLVCINNFFSGQTPV